VNNNNNNK